jgi:lysyl-tRNA synthetase class 2
MFTIKAKGLDKMAEDAKIKKVEELLSKSTNPYPYSYKVTNHALDITSDFAKHEGKDASLAGRIMRLRKMGKIIFMDLLDESGKLQVIIREDVIDKDSLEMLQLIDIGDILGVEGSVTKSSRGEISIEARKATMLSKSLRTLPDKFHGISDTELRYRKRYLDLIMNPDIRKIFRTRSKIMDYVRNFLNSRSYIEFETPILQPTYGGANAKPFTTYYNSLESDFYLRVANELYLKRLIIGGFEKVYEFAKDFRNEDVDSSHNPEFTMLEFYEAYKDYEDFMGLMEEMLSGLAKQIHGSYSFNYQGKELNFKPKFKRIYWVDEIKKLSGIDISKMTDEEAKKIAKEEKLDTKILNNYHVADSLFDKYIKPTIIDPTFILDFPAYMCPLTKDKRGNKFLSERFEMYVNGMEIANCYSELTNPIEQKRKFEEQEAERKKGDDEAPPSDKDFIEAIEYGMPPTAGCGIGMDRLIMLLTDVPSMKEVMLFPAVRPEEKRHKK